ASPVRSPRIENRKSLFDSLAPRTPAIPAIARKEIQTSMRRFALMAVILPSARIMLMSMDANFTTRFLDTIRNPSPQPESSQANRETLHSVYDAVIRGDFNAFGRFLTDDVELDIRGLASMDGNWRG